MRAQWNAERQAIKRVQELRAELEQVRHDIQEAERAYDLNRAAELRFSRLADLERKLEVEERSARREAGRAPPAARGGHRRGDRRDRLGVDRHPGVPADRGRTGEAAAPRRGAAPAGRRPGRGGAGGRGRDHPGPVRGQGPAPADRLVHLPRPDRRREDGAGQGAGRGAVRLRGQHRPDRHERVPGAAHRVAAGRRPARLRRLRGGRAAHRGGAPPPVRRRPLRRDREGAPGRLQHAAAGARRRPAHRRAGPHRRLPQHRHHHDVEHRVAVPARRRHRRRPAQARGS